MSKLYCKDCNNNKNDSLTSPFCKASKSIDLVTGNEIFERASFMRKPKGKCGVGAKLFEPKV
jgi:hypothetical protein